MSKSKANKQNEEVEAEITFVHSLPPETIEKLKKRSAQQPVAHRSTKRPLFLLSTKGKTRGQIARDILTTLKSSRKSAAESKKEE